MRKFLVVAICIMCLMFNFVNMNIAYAANGDTGTSEYILVDSAPIIDGEMDEIWSKTTPVVTDMEESEAIGMVSILWNETGLYYYARVLDSTTNSSDRCNFWVSETYIEDHVEGQYYPFVDGAYYLCLTPDGNNVFYSSSETYIDMTNKYQVATKRTTGGYDVELYVPLFGGSQLVEGNSIGFNVSIDDYLIENSERESYSYWSAFGAYWSYPSMLAEVVLVDYFLEEIANEENDSSTSNETIDSLSNSVTSENMGNNSILTNNNKEQGKSCSANVAASSLIIAVLTFVITGEKFKRKQK